MITDISKKVRKIIVDNQVMDIKPEILGGEYNLESVDLEDGTQKIVAYEIGSPTSILEYQPDADMLWAKSVYDNDTQEGFTSKILYMIMDATTETDIEVPTNGAVKTSDGGYYTSNTTHTWDDTNARQSAVGDYKVRWLIYYTMDEYISISSYSNLLPIFFCAGKINNFNIIKTLQYCIFSNIPSSECQYILLQDMRSLKSIPELDTSKRTDFNSMFVGGMSLQTIPQLDTSNGINFGYMFSECRALQTIPQLNTSNGTIFYAMFYRCSALQTIPQLNTSNGTNFGYMFYICSSLQTIPQLDTSNGTDFGYMFYDCSVLQKIPQLDTSNGINFGDMFHGCSALQTIPQLNTSNGTNFGYMFYICSSLQTIPQLDTSNGTDFGYMFCDCSALQTIQQLNLINATYVSCMFYNCSKLINLTLKNIKISIQIGSGTSWGHLLTLDSLLNTIKELHDNTDGSSILTLTVGSANLEKLSNTYVKLITPTEEMITEDPYIENKIPFEVCNSTDEGAMSIADYLLLKNWEIK